MAIKFYDIIFGVGVGLIVLALFILLYRTGKYENDRSQWHLGRLGMIGLVGIALIALAKLGKRELYTKDKRKKSTEKYNYDQYYSQFSEDGQFVDGTVNVKNKKDNPGLGWI